MRSQSITPSLNYTPKINSALLRLCVYINYSNKTSMEKADFNADVFGSKEMLQPSPVDKIPAKGTRPDIAYQMVKDETFAQTQPRLNLACLSI